MTHANARRVRRPGTIVLALMLAVAPAVVVATSGAASGGYGTGPLPSGNDWLGEVNLYRAAEGEQPITSDPSLAAALDAHLTYLNHTDLATEPPQYQSAHTEDPSSPYYSAAGANAAANSLLDPEGGSSGGVALIDAWMGVPFHGFGLLRPSLSSAVLESVGTWSGFMDGSFSNPGLSGPVLFPPAGMTTDLATMGLEVPDPTLACPTGSWQGLAEYAVLPSTPVAPISATVTSAAGAVLSPANGTLCVADQFDYPPPSAVSGPYNYGGALLSGQDMVILMPAAPLVDGTYTASITQGDGSVTSWSFTVAGPPQTGTITTTPVPGRPFSADVPVTSGLAPFTDVITQGALPPGLSLSPSGVVSGTTSASGDFAFAVTVTDARGLTSVGYEDFSIAPALSGTNGPLPPAVQGLPYGAAASFRGGTGAPTVSVSSGQLPPGLHLGGDGSVTGVPTRPGQFQFTVAASDGSTAANETLRLHVYPFLSQPGVASLGLAARPSFLEPPTISFAGSETGALGTMVTVSHGPSGPVVRVRPPTGFGAMSCPAQPGARVSCLVKVVVELERSRHRFALGTSVEEVTGGRAYSGGVLQLTAAGALALRDRAQPWASFAAFMIVSSVGWTV